MDEKTPLELVTDEIIASLFGPIIQLLLMVIPIILLVGVSLVVIRFLVRRVGRADGRSDGASVATGRVPELLKAPSIRTDVYRPVRSFLSPAERSLFGVLDQVMGTDYRIFPKVRLIDVIEVKASERGRKAHTNRIISKHLDYVVCDATELQPVLLVELDDASHRRRDRRQRDEFVDQALADAGLPILRVPAGASYKVSDLRQQIEDRAGITLPADIQSA